MISFIPIGFQSFSEYWKFAWAREFRDIGNQERVVYAKTRLERLGDMMTYPVMKIADYALLNIRNPLMILSVTLTAIIGVTILFYPAELMRIVTRLVPLAQKLKPWMVKGAGYVVLQTTIVGIGLRTLGRLDPSGELWNRWNHSPRQVIPIAVGTQIVPVEEE